MTKYITLDGTSLLIDCEDEQRINLFRWRYLITGYFRSTNSGSSGITHYLHRYILKLPRKDKRDVDHINGNKLDNRKENLRAVSRTLNNLNAKKRVGTISKYRGVRFMKHRNVFQSRLGFKNKSYLLLTSKSEEECAYAYDEACRVLGLIAYVNNPLLDNAIKEELNFLINTKINAWRFNKELC